MLLNELYKNPQTGFVGPLKLWKFALHYDKNIKLSDVKKWLNNQSVYQVHQTVREPTHFYPIVSHFKNHRWQADLMDVSRDSHKNQGITFLLNVIDVYTRYAYIQPLKTKTKSNIIKAFKIILNVAKPEILMTDAGSEFISNEFKKLMKDQGINHQIAEVADHNRMGVVERFNRTFRGYLEKYKTLNGPRYIDDLQLLANNYNTSYHTGIKSTPTNPDEKYIKLKLDERIQTANEYKKDEIPIGAKVRYVLNRGAFSKGSEARLSKAIHTVKGQTVHNQYLLSNGNYYKPYQLLQVPNNTVEEKNKPLETLIVDKIEDLPKPSRNFLNKEGIKLDNRRSGLRERIPNVKLLSDRYGQVIQFY